MKMKTKESEEARLLRSKGLSIKRIAKIIGASQSSVSGWVKSVELSKDQKEKLLSHQYSQETYDRLKRNREKNATKFKEKRAGYQEIGREMYRHSDKEFAFGCAMFFSEGSKDRNSVIVCNADADFLRFFVSFMKKYFGVTTEMFKVSVSCYLNNGKGIDEIHRYWVEELGLTEKNVRKPTIKSKYYSGTESHKYPFGICRVVVSKTEIVQKLFGAIKEAVSKKEEWMI